MKRYAVLAVAVLSVLVGACGGSDSDSEPANGPGVSTAAGIDETTSEPTRPEFIDEVDAICADFGDSEEVQNAMDLAMKADDSAEAASHFDLLVRESDKAMNDVSSVEVPSSVQDEFDSYLDAEEELGILLADMADAVRDGNINEFFAIGEKMKAPSDRSERIAKSLGFKVCAAD